MSPSLVWFRLDLRLDDNPALRAARQRGGPVVPVFVWAPHEEGAWAPGSASRWWLHQSLHALGEQLRRVGSRLVLRVGDTLPMLQALAKETGAGAVFWNRRYEPAVVARDAAIEATLRSAGLTAQGHNANLLFEPSEVRNKQGRPFQVFTPFWNHCRALPPPPTPLRAPPGLPVPGAWPPSAPLGELELEPAIDWAAGMREEWSPGSVGARERLARFLAGRIGRYAEGRDMPGREGSSSLSPHLHFGEISPRTIWHRTCRKEGVAELPQGAEVFLKELVWREFAHHLLSHFPDTTDAPLRTEFAAFPWRRDAHALRAWQRGRTGYPLVDAGMRQLWSIGWMHNRVRMVVASFLVKHLLLPWHDGARWFWDTLVDADLANNTFNWQWVAGCGADAAPYFRIFNPVSQGERFDAEGDYVRRWVPELARLPAPWAHKPWEAEDDVLAAAGVRLGETYPYPIVDHASARTRALEALATIARSGEGPG